MNKQKFLNDTSVAGFVTWAAETLPHIKVHLNVSRPGTGSAKGRRGRGVQKGCRGLNEIINAYHWRACWNRGNINWLSDDWTTTEESLGELSKWIRDAVKQNDHAECLAATKAIVIWGGDRGHLRNPPVGAQPFFTELSEKNQLVKYLTEAREAFRLSNEDSINLQPIAYMNSMISKVHALLADDGLPIYDSRVAAAIGSLVEIFRHLTNQSWNFIPEPLCFKATAWGNRSHSNPCRRVICLHGNHADFSELRTAVLDPGCFNLVNKEGCAKDWASAKIRLGWLLEAILEKSDQLVKIKHCRPVIEPDTTSDNNRAAKMHAFEAGLFMIGYDVKCLRVALDHTLE